MTTADLFRFGPPILLLLCLGAGKLLKSSPKVPNWLIPIALPVLGILTAGATAMTLGTDWREAVQASLLGLLTGAGAVGTHQLGRAVTRQDTGSPPPAGPDDGSVPPVLAVPETRAREALRGLVNAATFALVLGVAATTSGCTATQAGAGAQVAQAICAGVLVFSSHPEATPLCSSIPEIEAIVAAWRATQTSASAALRASPTMPQDELYAALAARRAATGGAK